MDNKEQVKEKKLNLRKLHFKEKVKKVVPNGITYVQSTFNQYNNFNS